MQSESELRMRSIPSAGPGIAVTLTLINLAFVFMRPQNDIKILAILQVPFIVNSLPAVYWLTKVGQRWHPIMKLITAFLIEGAIWVPLAVNNFWAFSSFRSVFQLAVGLVFPIVIFCSTADRLRKLFRVCTFCSVYLFCYAIRHSGRGPGDYLGDENDLGMVIVMFLGFFLGKLLTEYRGKKLWLLSALTVLGTGALVITESRGDFVGFVVMASYIFLKSKQKFLFLVAGFLVAATAVMIAPSDYWSEISSISKTDEGTAKTRREYWAVAWKMFLDPKNIIWGVGMGNVRYRAFEYEPAINHSDAGKSMSGRQVHSLYFSLLPELGLIGTTIFAALVFKSFKGNSNSLRAIRKLSKQIRSLQSGEIQAETKKSTKEMEEDLEFLAAVFFGINAALCGVLVSAAFISVLYYPPVWFLFGLSAAAQIAYQRVFQRFTLLPGDSPLLLTPNNTPQKSSEWNQF